MDNFPPGIGNAVESVVILVLGAVAVVFYRLGTGELEEDFRRLFLGRDVTARRSRP